MAMGGAGVACANKFSAIYMNPASFGCSDNAYFSLLELGIDFNLDTFNRYFLNNLTNINLKNPMIINDLIKLKPVMAVCL